MEDKELIELAAKAAGITGTWHRAGFVAYAGWAGGFFNPLTDDGDALRLAVVLEMDIQIIRKDQVDAVWNSRLKPHGVLFVSEKLGCEWHSATRRAITRAAAQIGKEME